MSKKKKRMKTKGTKWISSPSPPPPPLCPSPAISPRLTIDTPLLAFVASL